MKDCLLWEGPHAGAGEEHEEEGAPDKVLLTDCNTYSPSPRVTQVKEAEELGVKLSLGRREGWGEGVIKVFFSHYPTLI